MTGVRIAAEPADGPLPRTLVDRYFADLAARFVDGFDPARTVAAPPAELIPPHGAFLVAWLDGIAVGCGAVRALSRDVAEIKRMWIDHSARGRGVGRQLLAALEDAAGALGCSTVRLDTAAELPEALGLYRSAGYRDIAAYNENPYAAYWLEKPLGRGVGKVRPER